VAVIRRPMRIISAATLGGRPGQPDQAAGAGDEAGLDLAERELGGLVRDDEMADQRDLAAAAHGEPVGGDYGLIMSRRLAKSASRSWAPHRLA
jgi:hypothetical protein